MKRKAFLTLFVITFTMLLYAAPSFAMEISAKYNNNTQVVKVEAEPNQTVAAVKESIGTQLSIDPMYFRLQYNGITLENEDILKEWGMVKDSVLQLQFCFYSMSPGASVILGAGGSKVYFGSDNGTSVLWQVLTNSNDYDTNHWGEGEGIFLLSEHLFTNTIFGQPGGTFEDSAVKTWCNTFYENYFTAPEKLAVALTKKQETEGTSLSAPTSTNTLTGDSVFIPSAGEMINAPFYGLSEEKHRVAYPVDEKKKPASWWTRSTTNLQDGNMVVINKEGKEVVSSVEESHYIRPAINLMKEQILFTSKAVGGKPTELVGGEKLFDTSTQSTTNAMEWKVTLLDKENQTLTVNSSIKEGDMVEIVYSNGTTGPNQYLSAIITDASGSTILSYGKLTSLEGSGKESGAVAFTLPENFFSEQLVLKVFTEKCNGDRKTDYAGEPKTVNVLQNNSKQMFGFSLPKQEGVTAINEASGNISIKVPSDTDLRNLTPVFDLSAASGAYVDGIFQISGETVNDFTSPVVYSVYAEDGSVKKYTVTVERPVSADASLGVLTVDGATVAPPFSPGVFNYVSKVPGNISQITINAIPNDCRGSVLGDVGLKQLQEGTNTFHVKAKAENGTEQIYTIVVLRDTPWPNPFIDVAETHWFYDEVMDIYQRELMSGVTDTTFEPNAPITRGMILSILYQMENMPGVAGYSKYQDVPSGAWYANAVVWAEKNGIAQGYDETHFGPENYLTREELCGVLRRYMAYKGIDAETFTGSLEVFLDGDTVSPWAKEDVTWSISKGYIKGNENSMILPKEYALRSEMAAVLLRLAESL